MARIIFSILFLLFSTSGEAVSQLTQLDFDEPSKKPTPTPALSPSKSPDESLNTSPLAEKGPKESANTSVSGKTIDSNLVNQPVAETVSLVEEKTVAQEKLISGLVPVRHPIPITDQGDLLTITSANTWPKSEGVNCLEVSDGPALFKKSLAVGEIFKRLTGSTNFHEKLFNSFCSDSCEDSSEKMFLVGLNFRSEKGGRFDVTELGFDCAYQLTKPLKANWNIFSVSKAICECAPPYVESAVQPTHRVAVIDDSSAENTVDDEASSEIVIPNEFVNTPAESEE